MRYIIEVRQSRFPSRVKDPSLKRVFLQWNRFDMASIWNGADENGFAMVRSGETVLIGLSGIVVRIRSFDYGGRDDFSGYISYQQTEYTRHLSKEVEASMDGSSKIGLPEDVLSQVPSMKDSFCRTLLSDEMRLLLDGNSSMRKRKRYLKTACEPARLLESYNLRRPDPDREALLNRHARMLTELTFVTDGRFVKAAKKFGDILMEAAI